MDGIKNKIKESSRNDIKILSLCINPKNFKSKGNAKKYDEL